MPLAPGRRPGEDKSGLRDGALNSFLLRPSVEAGLQFDDNLFRTDVNEQSDQILILSPTLSLQSDWQNHALVLEVGADVGRHADLDTEDYEDYFLSISPRVDVSENTTLNLAFSYSVSHSARGSSDDVLEGPEPSINSNLNFRADWSYQADKYSARLRYDFRSTDADDNRPIERDFLDLHDHSLVFRQGYEFTTGTTGWLQPGLQWVDYRQSRDPSGLVRDNQGWTLLAGLTVNRSAVSFLELGLGVMSRSFEQAGQDDFFGVAYQARLLWNVTTLFTLDITTGRTAQVIQSTISPLSVDDTFAVTATWDPLENVILSASMSYTDSEYETLPGQSRDEQ